MAKSYKYIVDHLDHVMGKFSRGEALERLAPKDSTPSKRVRGGAQISEPTLDRRWDLIDIDDSFRAQMADPHTLAQMGTYQKNIENFIGTVKVPVGLAGPLRVNGLFAQGDYYIPLATTEAALVASYSRGAQLITEAGGASVTIVSEGVKRAPGFAFESLREVGEFVSWCLSEVDNFAAAGEATTNHGKFQDMQVSIEGNHLYLLFDFYTADASGQNMVTIATEAICQYIMANSPIQPQYYFIEGNLSGDKKASTQSFHSVRGKKATAEVVIEERLVKKYLHTTVGKMIDYWRFSALGGVLSGTMGIQGHYANGLTALYMATGQDVACIAESAVGVTRMERTADGSLYTSVTLPNLMVGTVGGGTGLPSQQAGLEILGLAGSGKAKALAEVSTCVALAGELSIIGAISAHHFTRAHRRLARGR